MKYDGKSISIGSYQLQVPVLFASYRLGDFPTSGLRYLPWSITRTEALLVNAYDFARRKYRAVLNNGWDPEKYLKFANKPILVDSGAYYFRKHPNISVTPKDILDIEIQTKAHAGVVLDHPFPPDAKDKAKRISTTLKNTEIMLQHLLEKKSTMTLMPVIHGHTPKSIRGCIDRLRRMADKYQFPLMNHVGIGSLAPLAQCGQTRLAVEVIHTVRQELPQSQIHCFSMGSALLMLLAYYSGADSADSQTWMVSAGFKLAQLPGHYVMRMGKREYKDEKKFQTAMKQFGYRLAKLADQEGFTAKDWTTRTAIDLNHSADRRQYVTDLVDLKSNEHVHNRACHNLWSYNFEVRQYRYAKARGALDEFIESRLAGTRYDSAFRYAQSLRTRDYGLYR